MRRSVPSVAVIQPEEEPPKGPHRDGTCEEPSSCGNPCDHDEDHGGDNEQADWMRCENSDAEATIRPDSALVDKRPLGIMLTGSR
jgi:hypothetical protein